jgi:hypothetical membrane protein
LSSIQRISLYCGVFVPFVYFGIQFVAARYYPGYSFLVNSASQLGSDQSTCPHWLNGGAIFSGILGLLSAYGLGTRLYAVGSKIWFAWASAACAVSVALAAIWAGLHPMPDPQHNPGAIGVGMFIGPFALLAAFWTIRDGRRIRWYFWFTLAAFAAISPIMAGVTPINLEEYGGLMQRIAGLVLYLPTAVTAYWLLLIAHRSR